MTPSRMLGLALLLAMPACDGACAKTGAAPSSPGAASPDAAAPAAAAAPRTPAQIRAEGNHLTGSGSLYLQQHAHNPVDWYPWGPEALERARTLDRPIFLSIGYASCHWCHVMEDEVFSKDDAAAALNAAFVAIKVDREERPDLDATYVDAVSQMTGSAGWPLTVLLTPTLRPFWGGTFLRHDAFLSLVATVKKEFANARPNLEASGADVQASVSRLTPSVGGDALQAREVLATARRLADKSDPRAGGFGASQKFPNPLRWRLLLHAWRKERDPVVEAALRVTLDAMANGGLRDHVGGGFHRYTVDATWTIPHFEKMLYVNAELADVYLEAGAALGEPRYLDVGRDTLDFLLRDMQEEKGGFAASFDADSGEHEGSFYVWTLAELALAIGEGDAKLLAPLLGVTMGGNFEGSNVLTFRGPTSAEARAVWERARPKLLAVRAKRTAPRRDDKVITAWNGLAIGALAHGFVRTRDVRYRDAAARAATRIFQTHHLEKELARASNGDKPELPGTVDDYADLARGLVALAEATGEAATLARAVTLLDEAHQRLALPGGGYRLTSAADARVILTDSEEPAGAAIMVEALVRAATLTSRTDLYERADKALAAYAGAARSDGPSMSAWLDAALLAGGPFYELVVVGRPDETRALDAVADALDPAWISRWSSPPGTEALVPSLAEKKAGMAYVCVRGSCKLPTGDPAVLRTQLLMGWSR